MKKTIRSILIVLLAITMLIAVVACYSDGGISIYDAPQTTYVLGQELNLEGGTLLVESTGDIVPLTSSDVSVKGYDKNKLGEQVLTVTYNRMRITFTVTVVERFAVSRATTDYFVGETFDGKGTFTLTRDDGTNITVSASDVTVSNFNTQSAGKVTVSLSYQDYSGTYDITVHEVASITLQAPKTNYKSHEPLDIESGYLTVSNADKTVEKMVALTVDMISGFDTSKATAANAITPLEQEVTVSYLGKEVKYTVRITYSNVSRIHEVYQELLDLDNGLIDDTLGEKIFEALQVYFNLSWAEQGYIDEQELTDIVQISAAYGLIAWSNAAEELTDALEVDAFGKFVFVGSYEDTVAVYDKLMDSNCEIVRIGKILTQISDQFANMQMDSYTTVGSYLSTVVELSDFDTLTDKMEFMFDLYKKLQIIPADVTFETLQKDYSVELEYVARTIVSSPYEDVDDRVVYAVATSWHMDGFFDLLYEYYLDDEDMLNSLLLKQLPGALEDLYREIVYATDQGALIENAIYLAEYEGMVVNSTMFMMYYRNVINLANEIKNGDNNLYKTIFELITFEDNTRVLDVYGYSIIMQSMSGNKDAEAFWNNYLDIVVNYVEEGEGYLEGDMFARQITQLLEDFVAMDPTVQLGIINSLYPAYAYGYPYYGLELNSGGYSLFTYFLWNYYGNNLSENAYEIFYYYLVALEYYANINNDIYANTSSSYLQAFRDLVDNRKYNMWYNDLNKDGYLTEKDYELIGFLHDRLHYGYKEIDFRQNDTPEELDDEINGYFEALDQSLHQVLQAYIFLEGNQETYSLLIASYERAEYWANMILESGNEVAIEAYHYRRMFVYDDVNYPTMKWTMDYAMSFCRNYYVYFIYYNNLTYGEYAESAVPSFMAQIAPLLWTGWYHITDSEHVGMDRDTVVAIMEAYRALTPEERFMLWYNLDYERALYTNGLRDYFEMMIDDDDIGDLFEELRRLEIMYMFYEMYPDAADDDGVTNSEQVQKTLDELGEKLDMTSDNEDYNLLIALYNYYKQAYESSVTD